MQWKNCYGPKNGLNKASIWRTQNECALHLRKEFVPPLKPLQGLAGNDRVHQHRTHPERHTDQPDRQRRAKFSTQLVVLQAKIAKTLLKIHTQNLSSEQATDELNQDGPGTARGE